ncbi:MAG: 3-hydroxyacyl-CoA dehydrogenase [Deltaproteobacteria bacterium]|nr:3-hydroxyacyl-CoA dehydrogenase [Deltaproteobacteria bacterium]
MRPKDIKNITCIGSGLIGQGWATLFAIGGYNVTLQDTSEDQLKKAVEQVQLNLKFMDDNGLLQGGAVAPFSHLHTDPDLAQAVSEAHYVQESVPDNYPVKKKVFVEIDAHAPVDAILASSSSGLLMSEIQKVVTRPQRCVLVHPFLPVHLIPLVEVVGGEQTASETIQAAYELMEKIGKNPVRLKKEVSGYIVNRLQAALLREAVDLVAGGVADADDIDRAFCDGMGIRDPFVGPLLRACLAGDGIENFVREYSDSYRLRWESMAGWSSFSPAMKETLISSVNAMSIVREYPMKEIKDWRDRMLIEMLKLERKCC